MYTRSFGSDDEDESEQWSKSFSVDNLAMSYVPSTTTTSKLAPTELLPCAKEKQRVIVHIDIDCFYAQVEMLKNPDLRDRPLGVRQKNLVVTSNYKARSLGLAKCSSVKDALVMVPDLVLVNGEDLFDYRIYSQRVFECIMNYLDSNCCNQKDRTTSVERLGMDENFVDVSAIVEQRLSKISTETDSKDDNKIVPNGQIFQEGCCCLKKDESHHSIVIGSKIAAELRASIKDHIGLTCSAGIAENKLLAKVGGSQHKPDNQTSIFPCQRFALVNELGVVRRIPGIGRATAIKLREELQIESLEDARNADEARVAQIFDPPFAQRLKELSVGIDRQTVKQSDFKPQSLGLEDRFMGITTLGDINDKFLWLLRRLCKLLLRDNRVPMVLKVTCRDSLKDKGRFHKESRQCRLESVQSHLGDFLKEGVLDANAENEIVLKAVTLLGKMVDLERRYHLTLLGMSFNDLKEPSSSSKGSIKSFLAAKSESSSQPGPKVSLKRKTCDTYETSSLFSPSKKSSSAFIPSNSSLNSVSLPNGWDKDVFDALPQDIKSELLQSQCSTPSVSEAKKSNKTCGVSRKSSKNTILNYFKKQ